MLEKLGKALASRDILQEFEPACCNAYLQTCCTGQFVLPFQFSIVIAIGHITHLCPGQDFVCGGGGGGGGVRMSASDTLSRAPQNVGLGVGWGGGYPSPGNFEKKKGYLRQLFVRFEDSLLGNKAGKSEGH